MGHYAALCGTRARRFEFGSGAHHRTFAERRALPDERFANRREREKLVVALYYYEQLTLREIGEVLGVTESRVSQLHTKAILWARPREPAGT